MSRAGRGARPAEEQVFAAAEPAPELPPEVAEQLARQARIERLHHACKIAIIKDSPPLWPGEIIGASIAEQWMQNLMRRAQQAAAQQVRARAAAAGIALPS